MLVAAFVKGNPTFFKKKNRRKILVRESTVSHNAQTVSTPFGSIPELLVMLNAALHVCMPRKSLCGHAYMKLAHTPYVCNWATPHACMARVYTSRTFTSFHGLPRMPQADAAEPWASWRAFDGPRGCIAMPPIPNCRLGGFSTLEGFGTPQCETPHNGAQGRGLPVAGPWPERWYSWLAIWKRRMLRREVAA